MKTSQNKKGFSLIEILVVIGIIGIIMTVAIAAFSGVRKKARDTKRKNDLSLIGRFISASCYLPTAGGGEYDLADLIAELFIAKPQYRQYLKKVPEDPLSGSAVKTNYTYIVSADGKKCAFYANLENKNEAITLSKLADPAPGGGNGVLTGAAIGANNTNIYYQYSN